MMAETVHVPLQASESKAGQSLIVATSIFVLYAGIGEETT